MWYSHGNDTSVAVPRREMQRSLLIAIALPEPLSPPGPAALIALFVTSAVLEEGVCHCWVAASCRHVEDGVASGFHRTQQLPAGPARATHRSSAAQQQGKRTNHVPAAGSKTVAQLACGYSAL